MDHLSSKFFGSLLAMALVATGCAGTEGDPSVDDSSAADLSTSATDFHGTVSITAWDAKTPDSRLRTPWAWDVGTQQTLCLPATLSPDHPVHSWDVEVTEDGAKLEVMSAAIKTFANGKPDIESFHVPWDYHVRDIDTVMTLYKKEGDSYRFIGKNDDGIAGSKGSSLERYTVKGGVYHVVVEGKSHDTRGIVGLFVTGTPIHPPDP